MQRARELACDRGGRGREGREGAGRGALTFLGKQFARFRGEHRDGARIPQELRAAVIAALEQGARQGEVLRVCKLSWSQVQSWQGIGRRAQAEEEGGGHGGAVRVFAVEDETGSGSEAPAALGEGEALELRLGPWSVSVRLAGGGGRGGACCR